MSKAAYKQRGESLDFINRTTEKISAGDIVVFGEKVGVAGTDIPAGELGSLHVMGVFECDKKEAEEVTMGTLMYYDGTVMTATAAGNKLAGYATGDSVAASKKVIVKLMG